MHLPHFIKRTSNTFYICAICCFVTKRRQILPALKFLSKLGILFLAERFRVKKNFRQQLRRKLRIGNAQGLGISSTSGVVSVDSEHITMTAADGRTEVSFRVMRVDTAINSGNSGGGLYDDEGNLIGIVNAKIVYDGVENIGYAIPSNVAVSIAENIIDYCYGTDTERVQRALLGITVSTSDSKAVYDSATGIMTIKETVSVYEVSSGSLADGILQAEDVLVSATVNGNTTEITRQYHIIDMMLDVRAGDVVTLKILRGGEEMTVSITITEGCLTAY